MGDTVDIALLLFDFIIEIPHKKSIKCCVYFSDNWNTNSKVVLQNAKSMRGAKWVNMVNYYLQFIHAIDSDYLITTIQRVCILF